MSRPSATRRLVPRLCSGLRRAWSGVAGLAAAALLTLSSAPAEARGDHQLDWWTIETKHFRVHYDKPLDPVASRLATLAETIHDRITASLGYSPSSFTEIVLTDDTDYANGSATALPYNTIRLFVTAPEDLSVLGDYDDWYLELLTHEYTHIAHTDNISGLPAVVNAIIGKTLAPNQLQPRWILEGLAVVSESEHTSAGRIRSSLFDAYMRADVIENNIATIDQFSNVTYRWPNGNLWYLYGSRFLRWITDIYGPNTMKAVAADYGSTVIPFGINRAIRKVTGKTYIELYEGFKDHLKRRYAEQVRLIEKRGLREGTRMTSHGRDVNYPRFLPRVARKGDAEELVYFRDDQDERSGIYRMPLAAEKSGKRSEELIARTSASTPSAFTPRGDLVFGSLSVWRNLYNRGELFQLPQGTTSPQGDEPNRHKLTSGLRAAYPDVSPDGKKVAFVVNSKGTTFLQIADIDPDGHISNRRDLVPSGRFEQAYTPRFSPDGKSIAYSAWTAGGFRDIRVVDVATGKFRLITHDRAVDMNPVYSPDGETLYFSSDRGGVFNIYAYDIAHGTLAQVTNVKLMAVQPAISTDGKTLVYVGYGTKGYDLFSMPLDRSRFLEAPPPPEDRADPPPEPDPIPLNKHRYQPLTTLVPRTYTASIKPGAYGSYAVTVNANGSDVVGIHAVNLSLSMEPHAPSPSFSLAYSYDRLPVDFSVRLFRSVTPRGDYRFNDAQVFYDEVTTGITTGVSYPIYGDFSYQNVGLSFSVANFYGALPFGATVDPYSTLHADPPRGNINVLHLGYSFSNTEGSVETSGPRKGVSLSLGLDYAGLPTGSSYNTLSFGATINGYVPMPWPGHHVLAIRESGAITAGDYPRGGAYSVGGYDLDNNSLPSTVLSGVFNGAFVLRGYPARAYSGSAYFLQNLEYRFPIFVADRGISTLPLFLRRLDGNVFCDYGGAFNNFLWHKFAVFRSGDFIYNPQLHTSIGAEIWFETTLAYVVGAQFRLGYAYGFSPESRQAFPFGQPYFVASSAF